MKYKENIDSMDASRSELAAAPPVVDQAVRPRHRQPFWGKMKMANKRKEAAQKLKLKHDFVYACFDCTDCSFYRMTFWSDGAIYFNLVCTPFILVEDFSIAEAKLYLATDVNTASKADNKKMKDASTANVKFISCGNKNKYNSSKATTFVFRRTFYGK